ncbi:MAG: YceI family protein [bacterium]
MRRILTTVLAALALTTLAIPALAATYQLDAAHSSVSFKVKHLAISNVKGAFNDFDVTFEFEPGQPESWRVEAVIQAASIDTDNEDRDNHLRSEEFLFTAEYPEIRFASTGVEMTGENEAKLSGELTMHGVTKPVVLDLTIHGVADFMGTSKAGFEASTKINRKDFGLTWHKALETGSLIVGDTVEIFLEIEGNQVKEEEGA